MRRVQIPTPRAFLPFLQPARYKGAHGGRGSGKSHNFGEMLIEECMLVPGTSAVCVREVQKDLRQSVKKLLEAKIRKFGLMGDFNVLNNEIRTPGGGVISFQGMADHNAESIKSLEGYRIAWMEEAQTISERSIELLVPTIRIPGSQIWATWNPRRKTDAIDKLLRGPNPPPDAIVRKVNFYDNPFLPAELLAEQEYDKKFKRDRYGHIWLGEYEPEVVGAIWDRLTIEQGRLTEAPEMGRVLVAVDPAVTSTEVSDEHGIVVAGLGAYDQRGYVLDDMSTKGGPRQWATRAVAAFDRWDADAVVVEINQGGDMVKHTLLSVRPDLPIIEVRATKGKHVRAEPISALYASGRVGHVGRFDALEDQMCQMTAAGFEGNGSPDRCDALVWVLTALFPRLIVKAETGKPTFAVSEYNPHDG
jgi:hypothetical protein